MTVSSNRVSTCTYLFSFRLMLLEENQITFHSEDGLIFDGVKDYARQIAEMIGLGSDTEFAQAGVSLVNLCYLYTSTFSALASEMSYDACRYELC